MPLKKSFFCQRYHLFLQLQVSRCPPIRTTTDCDAHAHFTLPVNCTLAYLVECLRFHLLSLLSSAHIHRPFPLMPGVLGISHYSLSLRDSDLIPKQSVASFTTIVVVRMSPMSKALSVFDTSLSDQVS